MGAYEITEGSNFDFFQKARHYRQALKYLQSGLPDWRMELTDLAFASDCALSAVISVFERSEGICLLHINEDLRRRGAVSAAMFQNIGLIETAIQNAQYVGASALVRQELEGLDVLRGIFAGKQIDSKPPRVIALRNLGLGNIYGKLSGIAHLTFHKGLAHLTGGSPYSYDSQYNRQVCELLVNCHVLSMVGLAQFVAFDSRGRDQEKLTDVEERHIALALSVLGENGFLKLATPSA